MVVVGAGCLYGLLRVLFERCLNSFTKGCGIVAPDVGSVEVADVASYTREVLAGLVIGVDGDLILEVLTDERRIDLDLDTEALKHSLVIC